MVTAGTKGLGLEVRPCLNFLYQQKESLFVFDGSNHSCILSLNRICVDVSAGVRYRLELLRCLGSFLPGDAYVCWHRGGPSGNYHGIAWFVLIMDFIVFVWAMNLFWAERAMESLGRSNHSIGAIQAAKTIGAVVVV